MGAAIVTQCDHCKSWFPILDADICVDCQNQYCAACAAVTNHRTVHQQPLPDEAAEMPNGWSYLRCDDDPFDIHEG